MVKHALWALVVLAAGSWGSAQRYRAEVVAAREPDLLALVERLRLAALRVDVSWEEVDPFGKRITLRAHGSGCAVARRNGQLYVLTARHVVANATDIRVVAYDGFHRPYREWLALPYAVGDDADLALVVMPDDDSLPVLDVLGGREFAALPERDDARRGALALCAGWGGSNSPAPVTVAELLARSYSDEYNPKRALTRLEGSCWYGFSGGPCVDARSGKLLGVIVQLRFTGDLPDGSCVLVEGAPAVRAFLAEKLD